MNGQGKVQFWENLLKDRVVEQQLEELEELGKGKRSRKQVQKILSTDFNPRPFCHIGIITESAC